MRCPTCGTLKVVEYTAISVETTVVEHVPSRSVKQFCEGVRMLVSTIPLPLHAQSYRNRRTQL